MPASYCLHCYIQYNNFYKPAKGNIYVTHSLKVSEVLMTNKSLMGVFSKTCFLHLEKVYLCELLCYPNKVLNVAFSILYSAQ